MVYERTSLLATDWMEAHLLIELSVVQVEIGIYTCIYIYIRHITYLVSVGTALLILKSTYYVVIFAHHH